VIFRMGRFPNEGQQNDSDSAQLLFRKANPVDDLSNFIVIYILGADFLNNQR